MNSSIAAVASDPRRFTILAAAALMQCCLGATYAWSVFVDPLRAQTGAGVGAMQLPFTLFYMVFPATMVVSGQVLERLGPRRSAMLGGVIFGGGWMLASLGGRHFGWTAAGIGLCGGVGVGLAYIVPIAVGVRWFPERKGLVTGVAVAGFGGGAALVANLADHLMREGDLAPFTVFRWFGAVFLVLIVCAGAVMRNPPGFDQARHAPLPAGRVLKGGAFWLLYLAMLAALAAGFTITANMKQFDAGATARVGATAVALFAVANAAGRVGWGWLFDRSSARTMLRANLLAQAALLGVAPWLIARGGGLLTLAALAGFNYGGVLVLYASSVAQRWGTEQVGRIYGWLFSSNIPAALAPLAAGYYFDKTGSFTPPLLVLAAILVGAAVLIGPLADSPAQVPAR